MTSTIKAEAFNERLKLGEAHTILDVRTQEEFKDHRLKDDCLHLPVDQFTSERVLGLIPDKSRPVFVVCNSGRRALRAAAYLEALGYEKVFSVEGGLNASAACGIGAASHLVLFLAIGAVVLALGYFFGAYVHPVFYVLGGLVGAGLFIKGMTGRCAMMMMLGKIFSKKSADCCSLKPPTSCSLKR